MIGLLSDDIEKLARIVYEDLAEGDCVVWAQDGCFCVADVSVAPTDISMHFVAGTYRCGEPIADLIDDLEYLRDSLLSNIMIESVALPAVLTMRRRANRRTSGPRT
jgi:hypothetical protein